jgi:hypothetical protein
MSSVEGSCSSNINVAVVRSVNEPPQRSKYVLEQEERNLLCSVIIRNISHLNGTSLVPHYSSTFVVPVML